MHNYKLIIFDWDGTLMNSVPRVVAAMQLSAKNMGFSVPSESAIKNTIGISLVAGVERLFPQTKPAEKQAFIEEYKSQFRTIEHINAELFPNAKALVQQLRATDKRLAVATAKGREGLERVLTDTDMGSFFHTTYSANDALSKPHPQMLHFILDELKIEAHQAVMIGDTVHDMEMAQRAGIDRIGVTYGVHSEAELQAFSPKAVVHSLIELQKLLIK